MPVELNNRRHSRNIHLGRLIHISYLVSDNLEGIHYGNFHQGTLAMYHRPLFPYILLLLIQYQLGTLAHMPFRMLTGLLGMPIRNCWRKGRSQAGRSWWHDIAMDLMMLSEDQG